jgi:hypothetical protein
MFDFGRRLLGTFRRDRLARELDEEIQAHFEALRQDLEDDGHAPRDAARLARLRLGGAVQIREQSQDEWRLTPFEGFFQDIKLAACAVVLVSRQPRSRHWHSASARRARSFPSLMAWHCGLSRTQIRRGSSASTNRTRPRTSFERTPPSARSTHGDPMRHRLSRRRYIQMAAFVIWRGRTAKAP